jgi:hypothetical protein
VPDTSDHEDRFPDLGGNAAVDGVESNFELDGDVTDAELRWANGTAGCNGVGCETGGFTGKRCSVASVGGLGGLDAG